MTAQWRTGGARRRTARMAPPCGQKGFALRLPNAYLKFKRKFENGSAMTRPSEVTRERIMKAAERLFAEDGS